MSGRRTRSKKGASLAPKGDLSVEREKFVDTFFRKGVEFVDELIHENTRLQGRLKQLDTENHSLRRHLESDDAIRELLDRVRKLEHERSRLIQQVGEKAQPTESYLERQAALEAELNNLANLYVAGYQLHSTLDLREVVRNLRELLHQLVGARSFAVYLIDGGGEDLGPILAEGCDLAKLPKIALGEGPVGKAFLTGEIRVEHEPGRARRTIQSPLACVPMRIGGSVVGVIVVFQLLEQKEKWQPVDHELFKLLGSNAATALVGARLYSQAKGHRVTLEGYRSLL